jgi:hypothetical protein
MAKIPARFSLATLLLLATIVCLSAALWSSSREVQRARVKLEAAEARMLEYRNELGYLTITNPDRLHLVRVPQPGSLCWRWRLYVPEENRFRLNIARQRISSDGFDAMRCGAATLSPGEITVHASVFRDHNGKRVFRVEEVGSSAITHSMEGAQTQWLDGPGGWSTNTAGSGGTTLAKTGETFALLRLRAHEYDDHKDEPPDGPADGLMIWISDSKKADEDRADTAVASEKH